MRLAFLGDVHGRVLHALATVLCAQRHIGECFDWVFQVGDLGAFPQREQLPWIGVDASEGSAREFLTVLERPTPDPSLARVRSRLRHPIVFIRGNHDDAGWLRSLSPLGGLAQADPHDLFRYAPDGTVLDLGPVTVGFLGGIQDPDSGSNPYPGSELLDEEAFGSLWDVDRGSVDILITHQPPVGSCPFAGGSERIAELVHHLRPAVHVCGHVHAPFGPVRMGDTICLGMSSLLRSPARDPLRAVQPASIAVVDTETMQASHLCSPWLREIHGNSITRLLS